MEYIQRIKSIKVIGTDVKPQWQLPWCWKKLAVQLNWLYLSAIALKLLRTVSVYLNSDKTTNVFDYTLSGQTKTNRRDSITAPLRCCKDSQINFPSVRDKIFGSGRNLEVHSSGIYGRGTRVQRKLPRLTTEEHSQTVAGRRTLKKASQSASLTKPHTFPTQLL